MRRVDRCVDRPVWPPGSLQSPRATMTDPGQQGFALGIGHAGEIAERHGVCRQLLLHLRQVRQQLIERLLEPDEPAALVAWLCRSEASGVTGAALSVDGGLTTS